MTALEIFSIVFYSAVLVLGVFAGSVLYVSRKKGRFGDNMWLLTVSLAILCAVLVSVVYVCHRKPLSGLYVVHLSFAMSPIFLWRLFGDGRKGLILPIVVSAVAFIMVIISLSGVVPWGLDKWLPPLMTVELLLLTGRILWKRTDVATVGRYDAVEVSKDGTDSLVDILYCASLVFVSSVGFGIGDGLSWGVTMGASFCVAFLIGLATALWLRKRKGRAFLLSPYREESYLGNINRSSASEYMSNVEYGLSGEALFKCLVEYFDKKLPYLNPKVNLTDVAKSLLTNKLYLSRAINDFTGQNFCQFVNLYRVKYAIKLFNCNNSYKVSDLAVRSGFNCERSFIMAFRLYMNISPSRWCKQNREKQR